MFEMEARGFLRAAPGSLATVVLLAFAWPYTPILARDATIRLPEELIGQSTQIDFSGFGVYNEGRYAGPDYRGEFRRTESRLGVFDPLYVANRGRSSFTVEDAAGSVRHSGDCRFTRDRASVGIVTADLDRMEYLCDLREGAGPVASQLVLGEPRRKGFREKLLARERRVGEAVVLGHRVAIESVHEYAGSRLSSQTPLGYVLVSGDLVVAAVDLLDWSPVVHLRDGIAESERDAAVVVALALAVLRDPASSALED
jgi:hypothetical protein